MKNFHFRHWLPVILCIGLAAATGCSKQAKAGRHLKRADAYLAADQYEKAEIEYLNVLRLSSTNVAALRNLGNIYFADEMLIRSAAFFNSLKKLEPSDFESRAKLARVYQSGGALKEAREEAEFVLKNSPTNEEALLVLVESATKPEDLKELPRRLESLRQKVGDKALFRVAGGFIALREKNEKAAESEFKTAVSLDSKSALAQAALGAFYISQTNLALAEPLVRAAADLSPIRSARRIRLAALLVQKNDMAGANAILTDLTTKAPDYSPAWTFMARLALSQKDYEKCSAALQRVINRSPENYEAVSLRAEMYVAQGKPEKAVEDLERLTKQFPKSAQFQYQLAMAALLTKDTGRAVNAASQAATLDRNFTPATLLLAELNLRKGDAAPSIASLNELLKRDPKVQRAYMLLGTAYLSSGKPDEALAVYDRAAKLFPNSLEIPFMTGLVFRQKGMTAEARRVFEAILQTHPDDAAANSQLVEIQIDAKETDKAAQRIQKWMEQAPNNPEPVFQMARIRFAQNDFKAAQSNLEKVISMNQDAIAAYIMLARVYYETKQMDDALEKCDLALKRNPKDLSSLLLSALILSEKREFERSKDEYEKILTISPQNVVALNNLAVIYSDHLNQLDKAYTLARRANELVPNESSVSDTLGWILVKRGDYNLALAPLRDAVQQKAPSAEIISHLGIAQYMLGDEASARTTLDRALKLSPTFDGSDEARQCLAVLNINPANADQNGIALVEKRLTEKPADPVALSRMAAIYERTGKYQQLAALYEKALTTNPKSGIANARLADLYDQRLNNSAKALDLAKTARKFDGDNPEIAHVAGRIALKSSDLKDQQWGLTLLQESSQKQSANPTVAYDLAWANFAQGKIADAETSMKVATANPATAAAAKRFLDFIPLLDPVQAAGAEAKIKEALQTDANYLPALAARAAALLQKGDQAEGLKACDQILARWPGFGPAIREHALFSASKPGDVAKALTNANRARDLYPDDPEVARALGILQYQANDFTKAARTLSVVAAKRPNDAYVQYCLGMSYYKLKQPRESKAALSNAVRLQADAAFIPDAQKVLAELK